MNQNRERSARELELIDQLRSICAALPHVEFGVDGLGHTTFRVGGKPFVMIGGGHGEGSLSIKLDPVTQDALVRRGPYIRTPSHGRHGWVTVWGEAPIDWPEIRELTRDAFIRTAPKRLARLLDPP